MRGSCALIRRTLLAVVLAVAGTQAAVAQQPRRFQVDYSVEVKDTQAQFFHVTATFSGVNQPQLDLALPVWTPGWYALEYYARNVRAFVVKDGQGRRVPSPLIGAQTWRIETRGLTQIVTEFDYHAPKLGLNQAFVGPEYAFFTGVQLFLEPMGHREAPSTVRFVVPSGWRIASALADTSDPSVYRASDYDTLVDAPTWLGAFQQHRFEVEGKPYSIVFDAHEQIPAARIAASMDAYLPIVRAQGRIFGGLPYDKFIEFCLPEETGEGALEHLNSYVVMGTPSFGGRPGFSAGHEHFHAWNVKRIRPAEMWPYDYSRPNETPSLWVSEGLTVYYSALSAFRAGAVTDGNLLRWLGNAIGTRERNVERANVSASDASLATWRDYLAEPISYYNAGAVIGALLDLSILRDTRGAKGLDDVMRALFHDFYQHNRGFTPTEFQRTVSSVAGRDYADFFRRFVTGTEVPPYDTILASAGLRGGSQNVTVGVFGPFARHVPEGWRVVGAVVPNSAAARAGVRSGDVIVAVGGVPVPGDLFGPSFNEWLSPSTGSRTVLSLLRDGEKLEVTMDIGTRRMVVYRVEPDPNPTAEQLAVRRAWLAKK